ncbi:MAG TPA: DUF4331 family protein [Gemmatimonadaceae bacterium]|nr:DUF4331 family protein [Gemmatimonadaceae bacterium]
MRRACGAVLLVVAVTACDDDDNILDPNASRVFNQIERLGNPLVSEVFFPKRDHGLHNTKGPDADPLTMPAGGTDVPGHVRTFVASFGRSVTIQNTLATVLSPDMLMVFPNRAGSTAGWLSWALANGYGGRKLSDDVVDAGLSAVFGTLVDPNAGTVAGLTSDNVPPSVRSFGTTFPYLETPRP